jgi:hypothetical protein
VAYRRRRFLGGLRPHSFGGSGQGSDTDTAASTEVSEGQGGDEMMCSTFEAVKAGVGIAMRFNRAIASARRLVLDRPSRSAGRSPAGPTTQDECKNGGWESFEFPRAFKNQGDCVQFVITGK